MNNRIPSSSLPNKALRPENCIGELTFNTWQCYVLLDTYQKDGSYCIRLIDATDSVPVATCTVQIPRLPYFRREDVVIKDHSENAGILDTLIEAGIVSPPLEKIFLTSYTAVYVCKLLSFPIELSLEPKTISENHVRKEHNRKEHNRRKSINPHSVYKG